MRRNQCRYLFCGIPGFAQDLVCMLAGLGWITTNPESVPIQLERQRG